MKNQHNTDQTDQQVDANPLMAVYNAQPPQPEQPARFYWQEPWHDTATGLAADEAVQAAFEN